MTGGPASLSSDAASPTPSPRPLAVVFWAGLVPFAVAAWAFGGVSQMPVHELVDGDLLAAGDRWRGLGAANVEWAFATTTGGLRRPLAWLDLGADHVLFGGSISSLRLAQAGLHGIGAALVGLATWWILRLTGAARFWRRSAPIAAGLAAVAWAVHPLRAETVLTLSARGEMLAVPLLLVCAAAWGSAVAGPQLHRAAAFVAFVAATAAGLAWPGAVGAVVALWALARWLGRTLPGSRAAQGAGGPLTLVAVPLVASFLATWAVRPPLGELPAAARVAVGGHALLAPLWTTFWPADLHPAHGAPQDFPGTVPVAWWVQTAIVALLVWRSVAGARAGRGRSLALLATLALAAASVALAPEPYGGDRAAHLATIPLFVAFGVALGDGAGCWLFFVGLPLVAGLVAAPLLVTRSVVADWATPVALEDRVLAIDPGNDGVAGLRGDAARRRGASAEARAWFERSAFRGGARPAAEAGLGALALDEGRVDEAQTRLERAIALSPGRPAPYLDLGNLHLQRGRTADAVRALSAAARLAPESPAAWFALGRARSADGDRRGAADAFRRAVALDPQDARAADELQRVERP